MAAIDRIMPGGCLLAEGPVWNNEEQALYWVDIKGRAIHCFDPVTGEHRSWPMPEEIGSLAFRAGGGLVAALQTGFKAIDLETGTVTPILDPEADRPGNRFNDGKCDRAGRFWAGTMHNEEKEVSGALYRLDPDGRCTRVRADMMIVNGPAFSPDDSVLYVADTPRQLIFAFDLDLADGSLRHERVFADLTGQSGKPDGMTVDAQGYLWSALWDGWRVTRFAPDGSVDREIRVPVPRPTSCAFGGPDLDVLYVTTAAYGLSEAERAEAPDSGGVLVLHPGVRGVPEPDYGG